MISIQPTQHLTGVTVLGMSITFRNSMMRYMRL